MSRLGLLLASLVLAAVAARAEPSYGASIQLCESSPGTDSRAARSGPVVFAVPGDGIFAAHHPRPHSARVAFWPASATERRAGNAHQLDPEGRLIEQTVAIAEPGAHLACILIEDATGREVAESAPVKFQF